MSNRGRTTGEWANKEKARFCGLFPGSTPHEIYLLLRGNLFQLGDTDHVAVEAGILGGANAGHCHEMAIVHHRDLVLLAEPVVDIETHRCSIDPFCMTIDSEARDQLLRLYSAVNCTLVEDVKKMPKSSLGHIPASDDV